MSRTLTASDRSALIRLASALPKGSEERRAILAGLREMRRPEFVSFNLSVEPDSIPRTFRPLKQKHYGRAKWQIFSNGGRTYARGIPSKSVVGKIEDLLEIEIPQGYKKDLEGYFTNFGVIRDGGFSGLSFEDLGGGEGTLHLEDAAGTEHGWMSSGRPRPVKVHRRRG